MQFQPNGIVDMMDLAQWLEKASENDHGTRGDTRAPVSGFRGGNEELMCLTIVQGNQEVLSIGGLMKNNKLRFFGFISEHQVSVLIASGATNNFMSKDLAIYLKLPIKENNHILEDFLVLDVDKAEAEVILDYIKMRSENELKEDCGTAAYYYLEDKIPRATGKVQNKDVQMEDSWFPPIRTMADHYECEPEQSQQQETHKSILVDIQTNQIEAAFLVEKHYGETDEYLHLWVKMSDSQAGLEAGTPTRIPNKVPRYYTISEGNFSKLVSPIKEQMLRSQAEKKSEGYSGREDQKKLSHSTVEFTFYHHEDKVILIGGSIDRIASWASWASWASYGYWFKPVFP
ncbi:hypothetical protein ISN44_As05g026560 [Arabidopsis suecica]|uniref:Uncharacterized protein n=1 Tax=Arabidopsis suecica TaxID=45249 RepID=A0A8T2DI72_ARASU|nr:hypothetical protein ISN44_As05g026560 [Arabidopsis suecica]